MTKLRQYWLMILLVVIILGGLFYWYEWRPYSTRKFCYHFLQEIYSSNPPSLAIDEVNYKNCLRNNGLEK